MQSPFRNDAAKEQCYYGWPMSRNGQDAGIATMGSHVSSAAVLLLATGNDHEDRGTRLNHRWTPGNERQRHW